MESARLLRGLTRAQNAICSARVRGLRRAECSPAGLDSLNKFQSSMTYAGTQL